MTRLRPEARNCCASALRSAMQPCLPALFAGLVCRPCLPALFEGADDLREEMTLLALVEPGMAASAQFRAFEPVEHEQRAFDPPQLLECEVELVLAAVGREFSQHDGRRHDAGLQRRGQAEGLTPVLADDIGLDALTEKRLKKWVGRRSAIQASFRSDRSRKRGQKRKPSKAQRVKT